MRVSKRAFLYVVAIFPYQGKKFLYGGQILAFFVWDSHFGHFLYERVSSFRHFMYVGVKICPFFHMGVNILDIFCMTGSNFDNFCTMGAKFWPFWYEGKKCCMCVPQKCHFVVSDGLEHATFYICGSRKIVKISSPSPFLNGISLIEVYRN